MPEPITTPEGTTGQDVPPVAPGGVSGDLKAVQDQLTRVLHNQDEANKSDPAERIKSFQSQADQARAELKTAQAAYLKEAQARQSLEAEVAKIRAEIDGTLSTSTKVASTMSEQKTLLELELAQLKGELVQIRLKAAREAILAANPELRAYAGLIPTNIEETELQTYVEALKAARELDFEALRQANQATLSGARPITQPARQTTTTRSAEDRYAWLMEAKNDPTEFAKRMATAKQEAAAELAG